MYSHTELKDLAEKAIVNLSFDTEAERLIDPVKYILSIGGKRLRPVLALMVCNLFKDKIDDAIIPATGLEVFHNYTLVHDDIMDLARVRRNFSTVHTKWNVNQAILSGDVMAFIANDCFLQSPPDIMLKVFKIFNKAAIEVCMGQQLDMDFEKASIISQEEYLRMIELKTAVLIAAAAKIGSVIGGAEDKTSEILYDFGKNVGLAFQIQDDFLDIYGDSKVFGKITGGDIIANKKTILLVKALETASREQKAELQEQLSKKEVYDPAAKVKKVVEIYDQLNIKAVVETLAKDYINKAFNLLSQVNINEKRKKELETFTVSLIGRDK